MIFNSDDRTYDLLVPKPKKESLFHNGINTFISDSKINSNVTDINDITDTYLDGITNVEHLSSVAHGDTIIVLEKMYQVNHFYYIDHIYISRYFYHYLLLITILSLYNITL